MPTLTTLRRKIARKRQSFLVSHTPAEILFRKTNNLLPQLALDGPEFARYAVSDIPAHHLGTAVALRKGFTPDAPENLSRAVGFPSKGNPPAKRSGA